MNLTKLFEAQAILDKKIVEEKGLQGQDLLDKKILALQVELGELANEWQMFKFWKDDPKPRTRMIKLTEVGLSKLKNAEITNLVPYVTNPLLEEYVDCLHFILSIGNDLGFNPKINAKAILPDLTEQFNLVFYNISEFESHKSESNYKRVFMAFLGLGELLEFMPDQVEQAYYEKNEINHERQANGY